MGCVLLALAPLFKSHPLGLAVVKDSPQPHEASAFGLWKTNSDVRSSCRACRCDEADAKERQKDEAEQQRGEQGAGVSTASGYTAKCTGGKQERLSRDAAQSKIEKSDANQQASPTVAFQNICGRGRLVTFEQWRGVFQRNELSVDDITQRTSKVVQRLKTGRGRKDTV